MARGINKAIVIGNLGRDPEIRHTQAGTRVASFTLATSQTWKDKTTGEKRERTDWHRVVVFNEPLVETVAAYLKKGSRVYLEGAMQTRKWSDEAGRDHTTTEVVLKPFRGALVMLDGGARPGAPPPAADPDAYGTARIVDYTSSPNAAAPPAGPDDEGPF